MEPTFGLVSRVANLNFPLSNWHDIRVCQMLFVVCSRLLYGFELRKGRIQKSTGMRNFNYHGKLQKLTQCAIAAEL